MGAIDEKSSHASSSETRGGLYGVVAFAIGKIAENTLALHFTPSDAPCRMACRGGNGDHMTNKTRGYAEWSLEHSHAAHQASYHNCNLVDAKMIEYKFM